MACVRVPVWLIVVSILDCIAFTADWFWKATGHAYRLALPWYVSPIYLVTAAIGLLIGVYGFIQLGKLLHDARSDGLQSAIVCVLFATLPGCAAIVVLLTFVGGHPV